MGSNKEESSVKCSEYWCQNTVTVSVVAQSGFSPSGYEIAVISFPRTGREFCTRMGCLLLYREILTGV